MSLRLADPPPTYDDSWARRFQDDIENESAYNEDFINGLLIGRTLNVETVVLTANADSTTVNDVNSVTGSVIFLSALNPRATSEALTTFAIAGDGSFVNNGTGCLQNFDCDTPTDTCQAYEIENNTGVNGTYKWVDCINGQTQIANLAPGATVIVCSSRAPGVTSGLVITLSLQQCP